MRTNGRLRLLFAANVTRCCVDCSGRRLTARSPRTQRWHRPGRAALPPCRALHRLASGISRGVLVPDGLTTYTANNGLAGRRSLAAGACARPASARRATAEQRWQGGCARSTSRQHRCHPSHLLAGRRPLQRAHTLLLPPLARPLDLLARVSHLLLPTPVRAREGLPLRRFGRRSASSLLPDLPEALRQAYVFTTPPGRQGEASPDR